MNIKFELIFVIIASSEKQVLTKHSLLPRLELKGGEDATIKDIMFEEIERVTGITRNWLIANPLYINDEEIIKDRLEIGYAFFIPEITRLSLDEYSWTNYNKIEQERDGKLVNKAIWRNV